MVYMKQQKGAVSIFIVLFATLLFMAISAGFAILMLRDQHRATDNDLSQSALDSAKAGVEDAKRVLAKYVNCIETNNNRDHACRKVVNTVKAKNCDTVSRLLGGSGEQKVGRTRADEELQQAYTCVTITTDTEDVVKAIKDEGDIKIVPLRAQQPFELVEVSWLRRQAGSAALNFSQAEKNRRLGGERNLRVDAQLPGENRWRGEWGSVLRVQAVSYPNVGGGSLRELDADARTVFLYPDTQTRENTAIDMEAVDPHTAFSPDSADMPVTDGAYGRPIMARGSQCNGGVAVGQYACRAVLRLPKHDNKRVAYLTLAGIYSKGNPINVRVRMLDANGNSVLFDNVQPRVDSTGRANNVFRRIDARIETVASDKAIPLPRATIAINGDICKRYLVSDTPDDFEGGMCGIGSSRIDITRQPSVADL